MRRLPLIILVLLCAGAVVAAALGALRVRSKGDEINVTIDKKILEEKAQGAVETTKEAGSALLEKAGEALHKVGAGASSNSNGEQAPATPTPGGAQTRQQPERSSPRPDKTSPEPVPPNSG